MCATCGCGDDGAPGGVRDEHQPSERGRVGDHPRFARDRRGDPVGPHDLRERCADAEEPQAVDKPLGIVLADRADELHGQEAVGAAAIALPQGMGRIAGQGRTQNARDFRTAQQDVYDLMAQARSFVYSGDMWSQLGEYKAYEDLGINHDRFGKWAPLNQSLYVGYKVMLAGLLLHGKGDRVAMNSSVEGRYPLLDDDVIAFCASIAPEYKLKGLTDKWILRQVAARTLPKKIANRPKTMFRASRSEAFFDSARPHWVDQLLSRESLEKSGYFDAESVLRERQALAGRLRFTPRRIIMDLSLTCVAATQLWHHTYLGGGLCDLPTWSPARVSPAGAPSLNGVPNHCETLSTRN